MLGRAIVGFLLCSLIPWFSASAQELIAVMDLKSDGSVSQKNIQTISDKISAEISRDARYTVFDRKYLPVLLEQLKFKQSVSCAEVKRLSDIGVGIGANQIVGGSIQMKQEELSVELNRVNVQTKKIIRSVTQKMMVSREDFIKKRLPDFVLDLMTSSAPIASETKKKGFFSKPAIWIGAATVAAAGAITVVFILPRKGLSSAAETDLALEPPVHSR